MVCSLASGSFPRYYWTSSLWWKHLPDRPPTPLVKVMTLDGGRCGDVHLWCPAALQGCEGMMWCSRADCGAHRRKSRIPMLESHTNAGRGSPGFPNWHACERQYQPKLQGIHQKAKICCMEKYKFFQTAVVWCKGRKAASRAFLFARFYMGKVMCP